MYRIVMFALLLLSLSFALAQDPKQSPQQNPPAPSASPDQSAQQQPPSRQDMGEANSRIQRSVESVLSGDPQLSSADIVVSVDDSAITLTGTVESYSQHQRVLALVTQYSRYRQIVDKIKTK
jgi:osmotically-inducible protein OsmY